MAKFELKFLDVKDKTYIKTNVINIGNGLIGIYLEEENSKNGSLIHLDKSTAIKFAKTLRTEINKIQ